MYSEIIWEILQIDFEDGTIGDDLKRDFVFVEETSSLLKHGFTKEEIIFVYKKKSL
jgi:hypothetical protein